MKTSSPTLFHLRNSCLDPLFKVNGETVGGSSSVSFILPLFQWASTLISLGSLFRRASSSKEPSGNMTKMTSY